FLRTRGPPTTTLFPYTTLFRSLRQREVRREDQAGQAFEHSEGFCRAVVDHRVRKGRGAQIVRGRRRQRQLARTFSADGDDAFRRDRKSTRLNSSHRTISYAVFC